MPDSIQSLLDAFPEGVIQIRKGLVRAFNQKAGQYLPQLTVGGAVPAFLNPLPDSGRGTGEFTRGAEVYAYSCSAADGELLLLIRPASPPALTGRQLEGVAYQLRTLLGDVLAEVGPAALEEGGAVSAGGFGKAFHRLFRLMDNLETLGEETAAGFRPVTMDLAGLCRHVEGLAGPLLEEAGVTLSYQSREMGLLVPGDPSLVKKLLLELLSNAARASEEGRVNFTLRRRGDQAVITVSHSGPPADGRQMDAMLRPGVGEDIPLPTQGAGLGMAVARHIVALHRGSILTQWGTSAPSVVVSLPTGPLEGRVSVQARAARRDGGLDPVLMELSDLLPARVFGLEGLD